jgi:hypothetical protein
VLKSSRAISSVNIELKTNVSEKNLACVNIIKVVLLLFLLWKEKKNNNCKTFRPENYHSVSQEEIMGN